MTEAEARRGRLLGSGLPLEQLAGQISAPRLLDSLWEWHWLADSVFLLPIEEAGPQRDKRGPAP